MVSGELRTHHYRILIEAVDHIYRERPGAQSPWLDIVYGPKVQSEKNEDSLFVVQTPNPESLKESNPLLSQALQKGIIKLWKLCSRAPFHVGVINKRDFYIEEYHEHGKPRGAFLIKNAPATLLDAWTQYIQRLRESAEKASNSVSAAYSDGSIGTLGQPNLTHVHFTGRNPRRLVATSIILLCAVGMLTSLLLLSGTTVGFVLFFGSSLLAYEAYIILKDS
jgi:hypothetical protein